jgi:hypothetical protein
MNDVTANVPHETANVPHETANVPHDTLETANVAHDTLENVPHNVLDGSLCHMEKGTLCHMEEDTQNRTSTLRIRVKPALEQRLKSEALERGVAPSALARSILAERLESLQHG